MESLSRPLHRRKHSNASSFSGKNAYDGVFSGPRPKFDGVPAVKVEEYREIFSSGQAASSIPILDLSTLQESSDASSLELGSTKPDYGKIFGGFCDEDIAVSYEELLARDKTRAPLSPSQSCQDLGDQSHQSFDALKQFNMSYNKISQRSKDGLDATTHVTQLHAVPGFTCFIDEATAQPKKETKKQKSSIPNNIHSGDEKQTDTISPSAVESLSKVSDDTSFKIFQVDIKSQPLKVSSSPKDEATSQPKKETKKQKSSIPNNIHSGDEKQTDTISQSAVESLSKVSDDTSFKIFQVDIKSQPLKVSSSPKDEATSQPKKETKKQKSSIPNNIHSGDEKQTDTISPSAVESLSEVSDDISFKIFQVDIKSQPLKVSSSTKNEAASQPKKETAKQKSSVTNDIHPNVNSSKGDLPERQTSQSAVESRCKYHQDESLSKKVQADINLHPSRGSSSSSSSSSAAPAASATNVDNHKDYQKRSTATTSTCFDEELDVNSDAAASAAALRKAIEKAQESIRIAKESVGRKKEGLRSFSSKSFKDSLKVKARVAAVTTGEEQKDKDNKIKETFVRTGVASQVSSKFVDGEKLFGAKKVTDEIHGKILESAKNPEIPSRCSHESKDSNIVCDSKEVVGSETTSSEAVENSTNESPLKDNQRPNGFLVSESCEKKIGDTKGMFEDDKHGVSKENKVENSTHESPLRDNQRPNGFLVFESCEKKIGDTEGMFKDEKPRNSEGMFKDDKPRDLEENKDDKLAEGTNNLTVYQKVEDEKKISQGSDQNGYEKRFSEALGLLEDTKQEVLEHEHNEKVDEANENVLEEDSDTESHMEEDMGEKFYDVYEVDTIQNTQTFAYSLGTNQVSPKEVCQMEEIEDDKAKETWEKYQEPGIYENSSSDYDDAEESQSMHGYHDASHTVIDTQEARKVGQSDNNVESSQVVDDVSSSSSQVNRAFYEFQEEKDVFENISADQTASEDNDELSYCDLADMDFEQKDARSESSSDTIHCMEIEIKEYKEKMKEESNLQESHEERPEIIFEMETGTSQEPSKVSNEVEEGMEKKDETRESGPRIVSEKEQQKRIGEVSGEERERERNRLAVERVIREARERAFVEARERAERAAVERATAEVRQRVMADAQEKVAKASAAAAMKAFDTTSKIKAERAAVERATAEARQRALEKAMSQNKISEPKTQANDIKQNPSSDLHISNGTNVEAAKRSKARLEMDNKIMERAAKALAEKEKRDLLAQKEQAERSRIAENLDADIKRWSSGKEGNLRALLSTLQYILGAESGWQPVSLTEILTSSAVKKAYRKATLCVHPDKLQQRGASIQHKYICEKVFDLLKAAWNRFNSEER